MKTQRCHFKSPSVSRLFRRVATLLGALSFPHRLAPIPVPVRRCSPGARDGRVPAGWPTGILVLLWGVLSLTLSPSAWAGQPTLPSDVPNIFDPAVRAHYVLVGVANLRGNPDFPVALLVGTEAESSRAILLGLDARNGGDTWSLEADPIILIVVLSDSTTILGLFVDTGFADQGKASGRYAAVDEANSPALPDLLRAVTDPNQTHI